MRNRITDFIGLTGSISRFRAIWGTGFSLLFTSLGFLFHGGGSWVCFTAAPFFALYGAVGIAQLLSTNKGLEKE